MLLRSLEHQLPVLVGEKEVAEGVSESYVEGEEIREELQTAWVPTAKTQQLLTQAQPSRDPNNLTCPALVADVRMVSR